MSTRHAARDRLLRKARRAGVSKAIALIDWNAPDPLWRWAVARGGFRRLGISAARAADALAKLATAFGPSAAEQLVTRGRFTVGRS